MSYNFAMGILYIVSTPIGNLEDITIRAIRTLFSVDFIACEDTRRTGQLLINLELRIKNQELRIKKLNINKKPILISYYDEIEFKRVPEIVELLQENRNVALVSDSGTPLISDPGFKLVKECIKQNIKIVPIPGPCSSVAALVTSGLTTNQFLFLGYLPPTSSKRKIILNNLLTLLNSSEHIHPTVVIFESVHRLDSCLIDLQKIVGDIEIVIVRELTKIHEESARGKISWIVDHFHQTKGEIIFLFNIPQE